MRAAIRRTLAPIRPDRASIRAVRRSILRDVASIRLDRVAIRRTLVAIRPGLRGVLAILLRLGATNLSVRRHRGLFRDVHVRFRRQLSPVRRTSFNNDHALTREDAIKPSFDDAEPCARRIKLSKSPLR